MQHRTKFISSLNTGVFIYQDKHPGQLTPKAQNSSNPLADTVRTDRNGLARSRPLLLGRCKVVESEAVNFYGLDEMPCPIILAELQACVARILGLTVCCEWTAMPAYPHIEEVNDRKVLMMAGNSNMEPILLRIIIKT